MIADRHTQPDGFQQTAIGLIPIDWSVVKLGDHAAFKTGPFGSTLHKSDYVDDGIPVINPMQIIDGTLVPTSTMAISEAAAHKLSEFRLRTGNVVIGRRGDMGRCAVVGAHADGWLCGTGSVAIRPRTSLHSGFLQRQLSSPLIVNEIENTSVGTTMINLNQATLCNLSIPLPPTLAEQEAIAEALGDADALIESLEQLVAKKRHFKQAAMQQLLTGKIRLPGFEREWERSRLRDVGDWLSGGTPSKSDQRFWGGHIPWVSSKDMKVARLRDSIDHVTVFAVGNGTRQIPSNSLLIVVRGMVLAHSFPVLFVERTVTFNQDLKALICYSKVNSEFVAHWLRAHEHKILAITSEATHGTKRIPMGDLFALEIKLPTPDEQSAISDVLCDMDAEIEAIEAKLAKARQIKQGMMQELLIGRIRLLNDHPVR